MTTVQDNQLSFWGWGEKLPPHLQSTLRAQIKQANRMFGISGANPNLIPIPSINNLNLSTLPKPRFQISNDQRLSTFCTDNIIDRIRCSFGRSSKNYMQTLQFQSSNSVKNNKSIQIADYVAYPSSDSDISYLLQYCSKNKIAFFTYGGGTSVVNGLELDCDSSLLQSNFNKIYNGVIICNVKKMNKILNVNTIDQTATVEPSVTAAQLNEYLKCDSRYKDYNYTLRHFPQSYEFASIGGMSVTNSGGHYATVFTRINNFIQSCRIVVPRAVGKGSGSGKGNDDPISRGLGLGLGNAVKSRDDGCNYIETANIPSSGSGINPLNVVCLGHEGTLGVVSEITVKLQIKPKYSLSFVINFDKNSDFIEASQYVRCIIQSHIFATNLRLISKSEAFFMGLTKTNQNHICIVGFESNIISNFTSMVDAVYKIVSKCNKMYDKQAKLDIPTKYWKESGGTGIVDVVYLQTTFPTEFSQKRQKFQENSENSNKPANSQQLQAKAKAKASGIDNWFYSFLTAPYFRDYVFRCGLLFETFETCVSWSNLPKMHKNIKLLFNKMVSKYFGKSSIATLTCRFTHVYTDGPGIYYTLFIDPRKCEGFNKYSGNLRDVNNAVEYLKLLYNVWKRMKQAISDSIVSDGGSSTHHHAVGNDHAPSFVKEIGNKNLDWMIYLKRYFDPQWICNPGVVIPFIPKLKQGEGRNDNKDYCPNGFVPAYIASKL